MQSFAKIKPSRKFPNFQYPFTINRYKVEHLPDAGAYILYLDKTVCLDPQTCPTDIVILDGVTLPSARANFDTGFIPTGL